MELDRASSASEPGVRVEVSDQEWTDVLTATEADEAIKFLLSIDPLEASAYIRLETAAAANGASKTGDDAAFTIEFGGTWEESQYAGPVCALGKGDPTFIQKTIF